MENATNCITFSRGKAMAFICWNGENKLGGKFSYIFPGGWQGLYGRFKVYWDDFSDVSVMAGCCAGEYIFRASQ